jgi:hypothetical protein
MLMVCQMAFTKVPGAVVPWLFHVGTLGVIWMLVQDVIPARQGNMTVTCSAWDAVRGRHEKVFHPLLPDNRRAALLAIILYLMIPLVTLHSQAVLADPVLVFYCGMLLWWILKGHSCIEIIKYIVVSGLLAGMVISSKLTGLVWIGVVVIAEMVKVRIYSGRWFYLPGKSIFQFLGIALLFCLPWMVRNIILTGNPIFPTADSLIPSHWGTVPADIQAELVIDYWAMLEFFRVDWTNWQEILGLVDPTPWTSRFPQPNLVGPWMLVLSPLLVWVWRDLPRPGKIALGVGFGYVAVWLLVIGIVHGRYMWPAYPVICAGLGVAVTKLMEGRYDRP